MLQSFEFGMPSTPAPTSPFSGPLSAVNIPFSQDEYGRHPQHFNTFHHASGEFANYQKL